MLLLCAVMSLSFTACSDDDEESVTTEYYVSVYVNFFLADVDRVTVVEYDKNNVEVANHVIECPYGSGNGRYIANPKSTMVKAFVKGKQVGQTLFLEIGSSWTYNMLRITADDL